LTSRARWPRTASRGIGTALREMHRTAAKHAVNTGMKPKMEESSISVPCSRITGGSCSHQGRERGLEDLEEELLWPINHPLTFAKSRKTCGRKGRERRPWMERRHISSPPAVDVRSATSAAQRQNRSTAAVYLPSRWPVVSTIASPAVGLEISLSDSPAIDLALGATSHLK
jgi:hypothetical protein